MQGRQHGVAMRIGWLAMRYDTDGERQEAVSKGVEQGRAASAVQVQGEKRKRSLAK